MLMSEQIAQMIEALLTASDGEVELQRNELAGKIGCVPSQINYVITSRFTPARGYIVESRRGGGGYIRIKKMPLDRIGYVMHFLSAINDSIDYTTASVFIENISDQKIITRREALMLRACLSDRALYNVPVQLRDSVRASILKNSVLGLLNYEQMR